MAAKKRTPEGHTLYWIYVYFVDGGYDFQTTTKMWEALKIRKEWKDEYPGADVPIFYGDGDRAFTEIDRAVGG